MELNDLKSAWNKVSSENERIKQLPEEEFRKMLEIRTVDITAKIKRNIRIGIIIVIGWIGLWVISNYFLASKIFKEFEELLETSDALIIWLSRLEAFNYAIFFIAILTFWFRYKKIEKTKLDSGNLRDNLEVLIKIISSYKKMFYIVMGVIIFGIAVSFTSGFIEGFSYNLNAMGRDLSNLNFVKWLVTITAFIFSLGLITFICYLLFNLFFKRLYGRYLKQLKETLKELNEPVADSK